MTNQRTELTPAEREQLRQDGLLVLPGFITSERLTELRRRIDERFAELGERAGAEFKQEPQTDRLANLVDCGEVFEWAISEPKLLACVGAVIEDGFKLSSLNARSARPHSDWTQPLHCDMGALPDAHGNAVCNIIWMLDDFTEANGATRFVPGSHLTGQLPQDALTDASAPHPDERLLTGKAGTVAVMNAHLWHGGTANQTDQPRLALHSFYCRRDLPQQQYQKRLLRAETQARLNPPLRALLALDDPRNDELSAQFEGRSGFMK